MLQQGFKNSHHLFGSKMQREKSSQVLHGLSKEALLGMLTVQQREEFKDYLNHPKGCDTQTSCSRKIHQRCKKT